MEKLTSYDKDIFRKIKEELKKNSEIEIMFGMISTNLELLLRKHDYLIINETPKAKIRQVLKEKYKTLSMKIEDVIAAYMDENEEEEKVTEDGINPKVEKIKLRVEQIKKELIDVEEDWIIEEINFLTEETKVIVEKNNITSRFSNAITAIHLTNLEIKKENI